MKKIRKSVVDPTTNEARSGTVVEVAEAHEPTARITLEDGTVIRIRLVFLEAIRLDDPGPDGKTAYSFNANLATTIDLAEDMVPEDGVQ